MASRAVMKVGARSAGAMGVPSGSGGSSRGAGWLPWTVPRILSRLLRVAILLDSFMLLFVFFVPITEGLFGRRGHVTLAIPGIKPILDAERYVQHKPPARFACGMICAGMREHPVHGLHCGRLARGGIAFLYDHLPPFIELLVNVDLHRADIGAGAAKCRGKRQVGIFLHVQIGR